MPPCLDMVNKWFQQMMKYKAHLHEKIYFVNGEVHCSLFFLFQALKRQKVGLVLHRNTCVTVLKSHFGGPCVSLQCYS